MGDIVGIYDKSGTKVASYVYDAWGNVISATGTMASVNPFRYRSYYYDTETGFYWLYTRYYDPAIGRFINADNQLSIGDFNGMNCYVYCKNNPISLSYNNSSRECSNDSVSINVNTGTKYYTGNNVSSNKSIIEFMLTPRFADLNLFGFEFRHSSGWNTTPEIATSRIGRIGFSSYITHTEGQSGAIYGFLGQTTDIMNLFGLTCYCGVGINVFDCLGIEVQVELLGYGLTLNLGDIGISMSTNLIGTTTLTLCKNIDIAKNETLSSGFTVGLNTAELCTVVICILFGVAYTGSPALLPAY